MNQRTGATLLATMGGQPQVVTFALDRLLAGGVAIDEVVVLHLTPGDARLQRAVQRLRSEFAGGRYGDRPCTLRAVTVQSGALPVLEIDRAPFADATWQAVRALIVQLKHKERQVHLCLTGGPRLIGLLALSAATLCFDRSDQIWHLYTPRPLREQAGDGRIMHAGEDEGVRLLPVPAPVLGHYFPAVRAMMDVAPAVVISAQTRSLDEAEQRHCQAVWALLTPRQQDVLRQLVLGHDPQAAAAALAISLKTVDSHKLAILAYCRSEWGLDPEQRLNYHWLRERFRGWLADQRGL